MAVLENSPSSDVPTRSPDVVMRLERMGSFHQSRLSFMRVLLRRMKSDGWTFKRPKFDIDARGVGVAVYEAHGPERCYSLVAFGNDLPPEKRSDRVIATEWDASFTLMDGKAEASDIARLAQNIPKQEAGRVTERELSVSRANRSARLWDYVVACLANGEQPEAARVEDVGYLMRTTAVYGSGKLGAADRELIASRPECLPPFQIEMLTVYLIRTFVMDLVEHMAVCRAPDTAVPLDATLRRSFGIGNSTGLGMAPFLVNHPILLNNWIAAREEALVRVRSVEETSDAKVHRFEEMTRRARVSADMWRSEHPIQVEKLKALKADLDRLIGNLHGDWRAQTRPWDALWLWAEQNLSPEGQEQLVSLLFEPFPELVDGLADCMSADEERHSRIDGTMKIAALKTAIEEIYGWALDTDWASDEAQARVWYVSEEKLEPRLGERAEEDLDAYEQPLGSGRDVAALYEVLGATDEENTGAFLMRHPEFRHAVRRVQIAKRFAFAEIRDNTLSATMLPIDMLRAKLSFFGAAHFDPRSDRWVRVNMFQHAPFPHELADLDADDWTLPPLLSSGP